MSKDFRVLFIAPDIRPDIHLHFGSIFEGVAYLSAFLKQAGYQVSYMGPRDESEAEDIEQQVARIRPDLIGVSVTTNMFKYGRRWAERIKKAQPDIPILFGGVHPTIYPEEVIAQPGVDMLCIGEGEEALVQLADRLSAGKDAEGVPGVWFKRDGQVVQNEAARLPEDLNDFPFPDLDLFHIEQTFYYKNRFAGIKLSRGCPFSCTYCCNKIIRGKYSNKSKYVRFRTPRNSVDYIHEYLRRYPEIDVIHFLDDILFLHKDWFEEFTELYAREIGLPYSARGRADLFDEDVARRLKETGCFEITFGVEAGNEHIRNTVLNRKMSNEQIIEAFALCRKHGLTSRGNNMFGLPFENVDTIYDTINLNARLDYKRTINCVFVPFVGSPLFDICVNEGFLTDYEISDSPYFEKSMLRQPGLAPHVPQYFRDWFDVLVHIARKYPGFSERLHRAHHSRLYPYSALIALMKGFKRLQKLEFMVKNRLGIKIRRYGSGS